MKTQKPKPRYDGWEALGALAARLIMEEAAR